MNRNKNLIYLWMIVFLALGSVAADIPSPVPATEAPSPEPSVADSVIDSSLQKAHQFQKDGKFTEAQNLYEDLLQDSTLDSASHAKVLKESEALNIQWLFSRFEMPGSSFYTVKEGDSLYKIAKENKTTIDFIKKSNGLKDDKILPGMKLKVVSGTFSIRVDKSENVLELILNEKVVKHYRVATGTENSTPTGDFKIINKIENPTWYKAGAVIPPGSPKNWLGTRWMGFDYPGYGIHGTVDPESIGRQASSGCIRLLNEEVEELYHIVPSGIKVTVTD